MKLTELFIGEKGIIKKLAVNNDIKQRLLDLGFTKGTLIEPIQKSPSGNPISYRVRGTIFAIRTTDASKIEVERIED